jgi:hypothetical protein
MTCHVCGNDPGDGSTCAHCGEAVERKAPAVAAQPKPKRRKRKPKPPAADDQGGEG